MANQITIDPTEIQDGEFSEEEVDSYQIGEALAQEQEQLLAGKYKDAQELESAYLELQKKLGSRDGEGEPEIQQEEETQQEDEIELSPGAALIEDASREFYESGGQLSEETLGKFSEMSSRDLVQAYIEMQSKYPQQSYEAAPDLSQSEINVIQNSVGGEAAYNTLISWAADNLAPEYIQAFDNVVESGNLQAIQIAVAGLNAEYQNQFGYEGRMYQGKAAPQSVDVFRSQAEVVRAMNDPRYENDPAYRNDVFEKLERSSIDF